MGVERLVPHGQDAPVVTTAESASCGSVDDEVAVTNFQDIGGCPAAGTFGTFVPCPSVFGDKASATRTEGVVLTVTFGKGRRVVDIWLPDLSLSRSAEKAEEKRKLAERFAHGFHSGITSEV
jgi:hypothetical protein